MIDLTDRLGLCFPQEFNNYTLFYERWISGCCMPPDMVFMDKENGLEIDRISIQVFIWHDYEEDYILSFTDSLYNSIEYLDLNTNKTRTTSFPQERGITALNIINEYFPYDIFTHPPKNNSSYVLLEYQYEHPLLKDSLMTDTIKIFKP